MSVLWNKKIKAKLKEKRFVMGLVVRQSRRTTWGNFDSRYALRIETGDKKNLGFGNLACPEEEQSWSEDERKKRI
jgi:hypothetical protein